MRAILELCVEMDELACSSYAAMAAECANPDLAEIFTHMSIEEGHHIQWWRDLLQAWDEGLVPDVVNDTEGLERHMQQLLAEMHETAPGDFKDLSDDAKLDCAARMEFFMLDPIFGELLDLTEPGGARGHRSAYARHLERIVSAIEMYYQRGDLARFLARVLRRSWRDNLALAAFATRDPLTSLYNRRGLMSHLEQWRSWAGRYDRPLGVLLIDVDAFKQINDTYGHTMGDIALIEVGKALSATVRGSDVVARYGGDEFAVVTPEANAEELSMLANRLIQAVRDIDVRDSEGVAIELSISAGGAVLATGAGKLAAIDSLLAAADGGLYEAKQSGKNRVGPMVELEGIEQELYASAVEPSA